MATIRTLIADDEPQRPALAFLDVQMPELDGFQVLEELDPEEVPVVVFVTAFSEFALRAFDAHSDRRAAARRDAAGRAARGTMSLTCCTGARPTTGSAARLILVSAPAGSAERHSFAGLGRLIGIPPLRTPRPCDAYPWQPTS